MLHGACRTANGDTGKYTEMSGQTYNECEKHCNDLDTCVAFEFHSENGNCELHSKGTTTSTGGVSNSIKCYIKHTGRSTLNSGVNYFGYILQLYFDLIS